MAPRLITLVFVALNVFAGSAFAETCPAKGTKKIADHTKEERMSRSAVVEG